MVPARGPLILEERRPVLAVSAFPARFAAASGLPLPPAGTVGAFP